MMPPVWLDVTETLASGMRTGIQRVTIELAREVVGHNQGRLIRFAGKTRDFVVLNAKEMARLFAPSPQAPAISPWQLWAARWGLVPALGMVKDILLRLSLRPARRTSFDWVGGTYLTAEVLGNVARFDAVRRLQNSVPTVLMLHDLFPLTAPAYSALRPKAFARHWILALNATRLVSVSQHTLHEAVDYAARRGQSLPPLTVCHPGHSLGDLEGTEPEHSPPTRFFLCVGTLEHRKNQTGTLEAYLRYREAGGTAALVVVGRPGPGSDSLVKALEAASTLGVFWYPKADDNTLAWFYRRAVALVYPSRAEGFGLPLIEALAQDTPCITSDRTSTVEVAELCGGCLVVDPEDTASLAASLARFDDPVFRKALVKTIRRDKIPTWQGFSVAVEQACRG